MNGPPRPRALVVYASPSWPLRTSVADHLFALERHGPYEVIYLNIALRHVPRWLLRIKIDLVVFHTIFLAQRWEPPIFARLRSRLQPLKVLAAPMVAVPQDEFMHADLLCDFLNEFDVGYVLSCAPETEWPKIYGRLGPRSRIAKVLTGYLEPQTVRRIETLRETGRARRPTDIGYRAWRPQPWLGRHGMLKSLIAEKVAGLAPGLGISTDISLDERDTLVGDAWYRFLLGCRYTIGVEGGASILDANGDVKRCTDSMHLAHPDASFEEIEAACFPGRDGELSLFALSPRHLEACATRTGQILVEGHYDGVLTPGRHYIPVRRDLSDLASALEISRSDEALAVMTGHAYADIVASGRYTYRSYIDGLVALINDRPEWDPTAVPGARDDRWLIRAARFAESVSRWTLLAKRLALRALRALRLLEPVRGLRRRVRAIRAESG